MKERSFLLIILAILTLNTHFIRSFYLSFNYFALDETETGGE